MPPKVSKPSTDATDESIKVIPYAFRNELELILKPGESMDCYNAKVSYMLGDIQSKKRAGSFRKMLTRMIADEELLLRTYTALPEGKGGKLRLFHDNNSRMGGGSYSVHDICPVDLPPGESLLLDTDSYLMLAETGLDLKNDFKIKGIFTSADTFKPRLDNVTSTTKKVYLSIPVHEKVTVPEGDQITIHPDEFLVAVMKNPNAYKVSTKLGLLDINRIMIQVEGPAVVYRYLPELSKEERNNPPLYIYGMPNICCNKGGATTGAIAGATAGAISSLFDGGSKQSSRKSSRRRMRRSTRKRHASSRKGRV